MSMDRKNKPAVRSPFSEAIAHSKAMSITAGMETLCYKLLQQTQQKFDKLYDQLGYIEYFRLVAGQIKDQWELESKVPPAEVMPVLGEGVLGRHSEGAKCNRTRAFKCMKQADKRVAFFLTQPNITPDHLVPDLIQSSGLADRIEYPIFAEKFREYGLPNMAKLLEAAVAMEQHIDPEDPAHTAALEREIAAIEDRRPELRG